MTVTLVIKRSGITIAALTFYVYVVETILTSIIEFKYELPWLADLFPVRAIGGMIHNPYPKYALQEVQTHISLYDTSVLMVYIGLFLWISYWTLREKRSYDKSEL